MQNYFSICALLLGFLVCRITKQFFAWKCTYVFAKNSFRFSSNFLVLLRFRKKSFQTLSQFIYQLTLKCGDKYEYRVSLSKFSKFFFLFAPFLASTRNLITYLHIFNNTFLFNLLGLPVCIARVCF